MSQDSSADSADSDSEHKDKKEPGSSSDSESDAKKPSDGGSSSESEKEEETTNKAQSSGSESGSDSSSDSSSNSSKSSDGSSKTTCTTPSESLPHMKQGWKKDTELFGIRRSNRSRKEPDRLNTADSDSGASEKAKKHTRQNSKSWQSDTSYDSDTDKEYSKKVPPSKHPSRKKPVSKAAAKKTVPKTRNRTYSDSSESSFDSSDEKARRAKTRRTATSVSYKEDSEEKTDSDEIIDVEPAENYEVPEEDSAETIERVLAQRIGKKGVVGNITTMYAVEQNGDPNVGVEDCTTADGELTEIQYLIKWKGWSHIHNTWESEASLKEQKAKGLKKLENFVKKEEEIRFWKKHTTPEDIEYYECQLELQQELLKSYNRVERVIAKSLKDNQVEYFIKWESLPYAEATWEDGSLIEDKWPKKIKEFNDREQSKQTPSKMCKALKNRPKFAKIEEQPEYMGGEQVLVLRDYQISGLNWVVHSWCKENSVILADEMGLGKTIQAICSLYYIFRTYQVYGPFLLVVPLSTMTSWQREFQLWAPELNVVTYIGDINSRDVIRNYEWCFLGSKRLKFNAILTTYEIVLKDKSFLGSISWAALIVDEAHRLKNDDSLLYKTLKEFDTNHRLLITGTPLQNSLKELWALLHFIMPNKFLNWEEFETEHGNTASKGYTKLHKQLEPFILRRVKKDVEKSLPSKVEQILRVEMTSLQKQYYRWILSRNYNELRKGQRGSSSTFLNIVIELKKCCNHAHLTKPMENEVKSEDYLQSLLRGSGKLVLLDKLLVRLRETGHRVLIFSQMVRMLDILADYLQYRHFPFQRLDGGIKGELRKQALDHFNAEGSQDFCFLLSTRAGGLGINLATADTVIIFDSDWNPQNDLQAQARAHRIGQKNQVNIYRLVTKNSVEENIVERAKQKMVLDHLVIQRMDTTGRTVLDKKAVSQNTPFNKEELSAILKFGTEELFKDEEDGDEEPTCDIDEILRRAETRDEGPATVGDELLSAFKVASFAFDEEKEIASDTEAHDDETKDWDEIIPESFRQKVEEEERAKEMEDLYLPPRNRKTLQQINQSESDADGENPTGKKRKKDDVESSEEGSDDDKPRKRGRPRGPSSKEVIKGFSDAEIRRFIRSFKRFAAPLKRLEAIACDAELQEKPLSELKKLGETLRQRCRSCLGEQTKENLNDGPDEPVGKRRGRGPSVKLGGVSVNAKSVVACEKELEPLDMELSAEGVDVNTWKLECRVKPSNFDCHWDLDDDTALLKGIYQYGMGSWEAIKMDPSLGISEKILSNDGSKPQTKHLAQRSEYLLKTLKKNIDQKQGVPAKAKRQRKKEIKAVSREIIEDKDDSSQDATQCSVVSGTIDDTSNSKDTVKESVKEKVKEEEPDVEKRKQKKDKEPKVVKDKEFPKKDKKKNPAGPMHFTANSEPRALDVIGDLEPSIFNECKEKMRPVKKALKALDNPDGRLGPQEQVNHTRQCLLQIGDQINKCLRIYEDPENIKIWRSNLWYFVSKFTEYHPKKLYKLYKHASKKVKGDKEEPPERPEKEAPKADKNGFESKKRKKQWEDRPNEFPSKKTAGANEQEENGKTKKETPSSDKWQQNRDSGKKRSSMPGDRHRDHRDRDYRDRDHKDHSRSDGKRHHSGDSNSNHNSHSLSQDGHNRDRYSNYHEWKRDNRDKDYNRDRKHHSSKL